MKRSLLVAAIIVILVVGILGPTAYGALSRSFASLPVPAVTVIDAEGNIQTISLSKGWNDIKVPPGETFFRVILSSPPKAYKILWGHGHLGEDPYPVPGKIGEYYLIVPSLAPDQWVARIEIEGEGNEEWILRIFTR